MAKHLTVNQDYVGSNPTSPEVIAGVAQLAEYRRAKPGVVGSNPTARSLCGIGEMVDAGDLKSPGGNPVRVRLPHPAREHRGLV